MLQLLRAHVGDARKGHRVIQHINLKIFVTDATSIDLADAVGVFHRWIKESLCPEMLIDVADYRHVPAGPGVMLIAHEANYSLDNRGLSYNRKEVVEGDALKQAHEAALAACDRLENEPVFQGKLKFDRNRIEVAVNDRLLAPNNEETWQTLKPELQKHFPGATINRKGEPRDLFRVAITT